MYYFWNPQTHFGSFDPSSEPVLVRGSGCYVFDEQGKRYFDGSASLWYCQIGHGNKEVARAIYEQAQRLETFHTFGGTIHRPVLDLCERLAGLSPIENPKILLGSGGSDAVDLALKLARHYWQVVGKPRKRVIVSRERCYHGLHGFGTSVVGEPEMREGYGTPSLIPDTARVSATDIDQVERSLEKIGPDTVAAIIAEPIIGSGGVIPPPPGYLQGLRRLCDRWDILLVIDEVITGFGRTGKWFASQRYGIAPDLVTFAKGVTSGYEPLGGVFVSEKVWGPFWDPAHPDVIYHHGLTYSGHALACAAALANLHIIERDGLVQASAALEPVQREALHRVFDQRPHVTDVRSEGLMGCVEFDSSVDTAAVARVLRDRYGQLARPLGTVLAISPPLIATPEQIRTLVEGMGKAADDVAREAHSGTGATVSTAPAPRS